MRAQAEFVRDFWVCGVSLGSKLFLQISLSGRRPESGSVAVLSHFAIQMMRDQWSEVEAAGGTWACLAGFLIAVPWQDGRRAPSLA